LPKGISSKDILYGKGKNDECYTPRSTVVPILPYIPKDAIVWCPFDTIDSEFVKCISKNNQVVYSHISEGRDFFNYEPPVWDVIVSNPPFTSKKAFFERALQLGKPFALLMSIVWLNDSTPKKIFRSYNKDLQLFMFDERTHFFNIEGKDMGRPTFSSAYFCCDFLPKGIILGEFED